MAFGLWATRAIGPGADDDGIELPPVTAEDNGKIVGVTDGKYGLVEAQSGGGGICWINVSWDNDANEYVADKTYDEIAEAFDDGILPIVNNAGAIYYLDLIDGDYFTFNRSPLVNGDEGVTVYVLQISDTGVADFTYQYPSSSGNDSQ